MLVALLLIPAETKHLQVLLLHLGRVNANVVGGAAAEGKGQLLHLTADRAAVKRRGELEEAVDGRRGGHLDGGVVEAEELQRPL